MSPELFENSEENVARDFIEVGDKKFQEGDTVYVKRTDGRVQNDWQMGDFNDELVVVYRLGGPEGSLQKKVPIDEFKQWQEQFSGMARKVPSEETAKRMGIDTTKPGWEQELNEKLRKISGT